MSIFDYYYSSIFDYYYYYYYYSSFIVIFLSVCTFLICQFIVLGFVTTLAGTTAIGSTDGVGTNAKFYNPNGIAINPSGTMLYVAEFFSLIRTITLSSGNNIIILYNFAF